MRAARLRLLVAAALLFGWLCWLGYLALSKTNPVVVSRSQVMAATHFVLAEVTVDPDTGQPNREVVVKEDLRPLGEAVPGTIKVMNLRDARIAGGADGFKDPGPYLLPLTRTAEGEYGLTPPPLGPGQVSPVRPRPWAYRWDAPGVRDQFEALVPRR